MHTIQQQKLTDQKYGRILLIAVIAVAILVGGGGWLREQQMREAIYGEESPVSRPFQWFGISCVSHVVLEGVPWDIKILHPPTRSRDGVTQAIQELPSHNHTPNGTPWTEHMIDTYFITKTFCEDTYENLYNQLKFEGQASVNELLPKDREATEADYRTAILQTWFPDEAENEVAERIWPHEAEILSTMERWD